MTRRSRPAIGFGQALIILVLLLALGLVAAILYQNFFGAT